MAEYISREALMDRVDEIVKTNHLRPDYVWFTPNGVKVLAQEIPAADVVEVVRCRECRYWGGEYADNECSLITELATPKYWLKTEPNDFCSSAERKDGGQDDV